jgi:hypothetical protein
MDWRATTGPDVRIMATRTSRAIAPLLRSSAAPGTVLSVHRSAANVLVGRSLLTIADESIGSLPNGVTVPGFAGRAGRVCAGMPVLVGDGRLSIDAAGLTIDAGRAEAWSPRLGAIGMPADLAARRAAMQSAVRRMPARGLLPLMGRTAGRGNGPAAEAVRICRPIVRRLLRALAEGELESATAAGSDLVGLGLGLTPSGDDLLVALTATLHGIGDGMAVPLAVAWAATAAKRTTLVAAAFHRHAAAGDYSGRLHDLVGAVLAGSLGDIPAAVWRAADWGATSGGDSVVGVWIALKGRAA